MSEKKLVLVAEDDKAYANVYRLRLEKAGYEVQIAGTGAKAIEMARSKRPDLIILDVIMPQLNGFETLELLKSDTELRNIKVIIVSNLSQDSDIAKAKKIGVLEYLVKSNTTIGKVIETVVAILNAKKQPKAG